MFLDSWLLSSVFFLLFWVSVYFSFLSVSLWNFSMLWLLVPDIFWTFQPVVYVAESAISSGNADSSSNGAENTVAITAGLALIFVAAASSILLQVGKNTPQVQTGGEYSGPSLSYYVNKFKPQEITQASVPSQTEPPSSIQADSSAVEAPQIEVKSEIQPKPSTSSMWSAS